MAKKPSKPNIRISHRGTMIEVKPGQTPDEAMAEYDSKQASRKDKTTGNNSETERVET